ncbi:MAG: winged helix-turn-helix transcriptional regulator [Gemmatimonadaceae bacterium]
MSIGKREHPTEIPPCGCAIPGDLSGAICYCGVDDLLRIIRRRYSLAVMSAIHSRGQPRYSEIAGAVPSASSSTLTETLRALEFAQLLTREDRSGGTGPHTRYSLTSSGTKLLSRLRLLLGELRPDPPTAAEP